MKKIFSLKDLAGQAGGEYVLGMKDLKTHACYIIYGELAPGGSGRKICPGSGHEEILLAVVGELRAVGPDGETVLRQGEAVHYREEETVLLSNPGPKTAVYVLAGGHSGQGHGGAG